MSQKSCMNCIFSSCMHISLYSPLHWLTDKLQIAYSEFEKNKKKKIKKGEKKVILSESE